MARATSAGREQAPIALMSDFGNQDHYVGVMKGVIASIAPRAPLIDLTHEVPPQSISAGALLLREAWRYFPRRTVFLAVVDPGVGTTRRAVAVETVAGARFVGPDNGLLWLAVEQAGFKRAVELSSPRYRLDKVSNTFHGRDVFAPAAAHIWRGVPLEDFGQPVSQLVRTELRAVERSHSRLRGEVLYVDRFGNLITNISRAEFDQFASHFSGKELWTTIENKIARVPIRRTYAEAGEGEVVALFGSLEMLEVAVRNGSAAERLGVGVGTTVEVTVDE